MTNNDSMPAEPEPLTEYQFTRTNITARNLEMLRAVACLVISRNNSKFDELDKRFWALTVEIQKIREILESIALVVSKTYSERGDAYQLMDDIALMRIRDMLLQYVPDIFNLSEEQKWRRLRKRLRQLRRERSLQHRS